MTNDLAYFKYLQKRSRLGGLYRKYWLYPKLNAYLNGDMLDVGCGIGDMLIFRPNAVGVDINPFNVSFCKWRGCTVLHMQPDLLPFEDQSFDSILLDNVLEHIENPIPLFTEIKRVMRPDAIVLIGVPGVKGQSADLDHKVYYDEKCLIALADQQGFKVNIFLHTPLWKSDFLSRIVKQYCIFTQWSLKV